jgi:hypothetical protein
MNSYLKTLVLIFSISILSFAISKSLDFSEFYPSELDPFRNSRPGSKDFRENLHGFKAKVFEDIEQNWCRKFNCKSM